MLKTQTDFEQAEKELINSKRLSDEALNLFYNAIDRSKKITLKLYKNIIECEKKHNIVCKNKQFFDESLNKSNI